MKKKEGRPRIEDESRQRSVPRTIRFTPLESAQIDRKMEELGYPTFSKMITDLLFLQEMKVRKREVEAFLVHINRIGNNINQIAYRLNANEERRLVASDILRLEELRSLLLEVLKNV